MAGPEEFVRPRPGPDPASAPAVGLLRRCVFAASVLHDLDLYLEPDGAGGERLRIGDGPTALLVGWHRLEEALGGLPPDDADAPARLANWVRCRRLLADCPPALLARSACVVGLPAGHVLHPGAAWERERVPGGALSLGLGLTADLGCDAPALLLPPGTLADAGLDGQAWWREARVRLEELGTFAADRSRRRGSEPLRPMGAADVVTLLGAASLRRALAGREMVGMVVPMRTRGWLATSALDPAFGPAAAAATDPEQRGFVRPLLVTAEEVVLVPPGGRPFTGLGR